MEGVSSWTRDRQRQRLEDFVRQEETATRPASEPEDPEPSLLRSKRTLVLCSVLQVDVYMDSRKSFYLTSGMCMIDHFECHFISQVSM